MASQARFNHSWTVQQLPTLVKNKYRLLPQGDIARRNFHQTYRPGAPQDDKCFHTVHMRHCGTPGHDDFDEYYTRNHILKTHGHESGENGCDCVKDDDGTYRATQMGHPAVVRRAINDLPKERCPRCQQDLLTKPAGSAQGGGRGGTGGRKRGGGGGGRGSSAGKKPIGIVKSTGGGGKIDSSPFAGGVQPGKRY